MRHDVCARAELKTGVRSRRGTSPRKSPAVKSYSRKLRLYPVNIGDYAQSPFVKHVEPGSLTASYEPFSSLESNIGGVLRHPGAFGFIKTGKDFGLPQLGWSKHAALIISINNRETCVTTECYQ
jgi:hypothetical protein